MYWSWFTTADDCIPALWLLCGPSIVFLLASTSCARDDAALSSTGAERLGFPSHSLVKITDWDGLGRFQGDGNRNKTGHSDA